MVGAVLVKEGQIIGEGYHQAYGQAHAEVNAIGNLKNLEGASLYVTLEPCCHHGKTPPCTQLIIQSGIKHVVVGTLDPNPLVAGKGIEALRAEGIQVDLGCLEDEIWDMNRFFRHYIQKKRPYIIMKYAMTLDGNIATPQGDSMWITNERARVAVHQTRHEVMGILVGSQTILEDDPRLTARIPGGLNPRPIILDGRGRTGLGAQVLVQPCIIFTDSMEEDKFQALSRRGHLVFREPGLTRDLNKVLDYLGQEGIDSVLVEGGGRVHASFMEAGLVNEVHAYIGMKLIGQGLSPVRGWSCDTMAQGLSMNQVTYQVLDGDLCIKGKIERKQACLQE